MKRKATGILVIGLIVASLIGCGANTANNEETPVIAEVGTSAPTEVETPESTPEATATPEPTPEPTETPAPEPEVTVIEVVELSDGNATGTETRYSNGTSDYKISFTGTFGTGSYEVKGLESGMIIKDYDEAVRLMYWGKEDDIDKCYAIYFRPMDNMSEMDLKNMSDKEIMKISGDAIPETFQKIETETTYETLVQYNDDNDTGFDRIINDYETGKAYYIWGETMSTPWYPDLDTLLEICKSINIIE